MKQSTLRTVRGGIDVPFIPTPTEALQTKLNVALSFIFTGNLPIIVARGKQMETEVQRDVWKLIAQEH